MLGSRAVVFIAMAFAHFGCGGAQPGPVEPRPVIEVPPAPASEPPAVAVRTDAVKGLAGLEIGMSTQALFERMGQPERTASQEEEREEWEAAGYSTARSIIFANGFDRVLVFTPGRVPLFKAFATGESVVALKFVLYGAEEFLAEKPVGFDACVLGAPASAAIKAFGEPEITQHEQAMSSLDKLHYFDRGITVTSEKGKIVVFDLYAPPTQATKRTVLDLLGTPRRAL
jgi:hypothetical protein